MKRTVSQLFKLRTRTQRLFSIAGAVYVIAGFYLGAPESFIFQSLLVSGLIIYFSIYFHFGILIQERFTYLTSCLMDPELIEEDAHRAYSKSSRYWKTRLSWYYYESVRLDLTGDFMGALQACEKMPAHSKASSDLKDYSLMHCYVRTGELEKAAGLVKRILDLSSNKSYKFSCVLLLGEYYLEMGFYNKANEYLLKVSKHAKSNNVKLEISYTLARLHEKEGNIETALKHYQQAAAIGPKTWMGQEAARRIVALTASAAEPSKIEPISER